VAGGLARSAKGIGFVANGKGFVTKGIAFATVGIAVDAKGIAPVIKGIGSVSSRKLHAVGGAVQRFRRRFAVAQPSHNPNRIPSFNPELVRAGRARSYPGST
jgi:hypothetical protein